MIISTTLGNETLSAGASKFHLFFTPTLQFPGKEIHVGVMARQSGGEGYGVSRVGYPSIIPAMQGGGEQFGKWTTVNYDVPEGAVFKVFGYRKMANQSRPLSGSQLIRMRASGALQRVKMTTVQSTKSTLSSVYVEGRFDLLTPEEGDQLGVNIPPVYRPGFHPDHVATLFSYEVMDAEREAKIETIARVVENADGEKVEVVSRRSRRNMDL